MKVLSLFKDGRRMLPSLSFDVTTVSHMHLYMKSLVDVSNSRVIVELVKPQNVDDPFSIAVVRVVFKLAFDRLFLLFWSLEAKIVSFP